MGWPNLPSQRRGRIRLGPPTPDFLSSSGEFRRNVDSQSGVGLPDLSDAQQQSKVHRLVNLSEFQEEEVRNYGFHAVVQSTKCRPRQRRRFANMLEVHALSFPHIGIAGSDHRTT